MISRRMVTVGLAAFAGTGAGCRFYSDPPPVVIGGAEVAKDRPIMAALEASTDHTKLVAALRATGVDERLNGLGPMTMFAPNDRAFDLLRPKSVKAEAANDVGLMKQILLGHIVEARLTMEDLLLALPQLGGKTKVFSMNKQVIRMSGNADNPRLLDLRRRSAKILERDAIASNGIIHVTSEILLPDAEALVSP